MTAIIGIDWGQKRVGLAITHSRQLSSPFLIIRQDSLFWKNLVSAFKETGAKTVVVGMPFSVEGKPTDQSRLVDQFINKFQQKLPEIDIKVENEYLTSVSAGKRQGASADDISAVLILNQYLNKINQNANQT